VHVTLDGNSQNDVHPAILAEDFNTALDVKFHINGHDEGHVYANSH